MIISLTILAWLLGIWFFIGSMCYLIDMRLLNKYPYEWSDLWVALICGFAGPFGLTVIASPIYIIVGEKLSRLNLWCKVIKIQYNCYQGTRWQKLKFITTSTYRILKRWLKKES